MLPRFFAEHRTVGFDLDDTLALTSPGIRLSLLATREKTGVDIDVDGIVGRKGSPIPNELARFFKEEDRLQGALRIFRGFMAEIGVQAAEKLPGADRAVDVVHELGGRVIVLTAKHQPIAEATIEHLGLPVDRIVGDLVSAEQKAEALKDAEAWGYIGDYIKDMQAANLAGVWAVGVVTGACSAAELWQAGANNVISTLEVFPRIFLPPGPR